MAPYLKYNLGICFPPNLFNRFPVYHDFLNIKIDMNISLKHPVWFEMINLCRSVTKKGVILISNKSIDKNPHQNPYTKAFDLIFIYFLIGYQYKGIL